MNTLMKRYKQLLELSPSEVYIIFVALFLLPITAILLKIKGFNQTQRILNQLSKNGSDSELSKERQKAKAQSITRMVSITASYGPCRVKCLNKSLVSRWLLRKRGITSDLKIGASKDSSENFNAHAWLEIQGVVINDSKDVGSRFSVFDSERL